MIIFIRIKAGLDLMRDEIHAAMTAIVTEKGEMDLNLRYCKISMLLRKPQVGVSRR